MDTKATGLVQGTLHMLILKTLALEPMHGYGIGVGSSRSAKACSRSTPARCFQRCAAWSATG